MFLWGWNLQGCYMLAMSILEKMIFEIRWKLFGYFLNTDAYDLSINGLTEQTLKTTDINKE